jgi:hypothetical protein
MRMIAMFIAPFIPYFLSTIIFHNCQVSIQQTILKVSSKLQKKYDVKTSPGNYLTVI